MNKEGYISVSVQAFQRKEGRLFAAPRREPEAAETILALLIPRAVPVAGTAVVLVPVHVRAYTTAAGVTGVTGIAAPATIHLIQTESDTLSVAALGPSVAGMAASAAIEIILIQVEIGTFSIAALIPTHAGIAAAAAIVLIVIDADTTSVTALLPPGADGTGTTAIVRFRSLHTPAVPAGFPGRC